MELTPMFRKSLERLLSQSKGLDYRISTEIRTAELIGLMPGNCWR